MLALRRTVAVSRAVARSFAAHAAPAAGAAATEVDPEHQAWLQKVKGYKVVVPKMEWTLEWALPTPVPQHQFEQSPVVIEVADRHPDPEKLVTNGPDAVGGYPDPENPAGPFLTMEQHLARGYSACRGREWISNTGAHAEPAGAARFPEKYHASLQ